MDLFAHAIEAVRADSPANRVVLVGHSIGTPVILRYATLYPQHVAALVLVDGLMLDGPPTAGRGAAMGGPDGRKNREAQIQRFFVPATSPAVQDKVRRMMLGAADATAVGAMNATVEASGRTEQIPRVPVLAIYAGRRWLAAQSCCRTFPRPSTCRSPTPDTSSCSRNRRSSTACRSSF